MPILVHLFGLMTSLVLKPEPVSVTQSLLYFFSVSAPWFPILLLLTLMFLIWSLVKKKRIEQALFTATTTFTGLFIASLFGVFVIGSGWVAASGFLGAALYSLVQAVVFLKGRG